MWGAILLVQCEHIMAMEWMARVRHMLTGQLVHCRLQEYVLGDAPKLGASKVKGGLQSMVLLLLDTEGLSLVGIRLKQEKGYHPFRNTLYVWQSILLKDRYKYYWVWHFWINRECMESFCTIFVLYMFFNSEWGIEMVKMSKFPKENTGVHVNYLPQSLLPLYLYEVLRITTISLTI